MSLFHQVHVLRIQHRPAGIAAITAGLPFAAWPASRFPLLRLRHNVIAYAACASFVYVAFTASHPSDTYAAFVTLSIGGLGLGE